jgi:hypothetical protein
LGDPLRSLLKLIMNIPLAQNRLLFLLISHSTRANKRWNHSPSNFLQLNRYLKECYFELETEGSVKQGG